MPREPVQVVLFDVPARPKATRRRGPPSRRWGEPTPAAWAVECPECGVSAWVTCGDADDDQVVDYVHQSRIDAGAARMRKLIGTT